MAKRYLVKYSCHTYIEAEDISEIEMLLQDMEVDDYKIIESM